MNSSDLASNRALSFAELTVLASTSFLIVGSSPGGVTFTVLESLGSLLIVNVAWLGISTSVDGATIY